MEIIFLYDEIEQFYTHLETAFKIRSSLKILGKCGKRFGKQIRSKVNIYIRKHQDGSTYVNISGTRLGFAFDMCHKSVVFACLSDPLFSNGHHL